MPYADGTTVSVAQSKAEIEDILRRYGATSFATGWDGPTRRAVLSFVAGGKQLRFEVGLPALEEVSHKVKRIRSGTTRAERLSIELEKEERRLWRALALAIKAKLELVESGITTFEMEFMAHVVLPNQQTVGEWMVPQINTAYERRKMPPFLALGPVEGK